MKSKGLFPRLMIVNLNGEDPAELVWRYLPVARAKLGFDVDAVWCNQADFEGLRRSLTGITVMASGYCPPGYFQLGKWQKGGDKEWRVSKRGRS